jgi:antitoxin component of RelBE/YafQ-DinJ toxin-antitoxin module
MTDGSEDSSDQQAFIGFYCDQEVKERVEQEAEERGTSVSEVVRKGLSQDEGDA